MAPYKCRPFKCQCVIDILLDNMHKKKTILEIQALAKYFQLMQIHQTFSIRIQGIPQTSMSMGTSNSKSASSLALYVINSFYLLNFSSFIYFFNVNLGEIQLEDQNFPFFVLHIVFLALHFLIIFIN